MMFKLVVVCLDCVIFQWTKLIAYFCSVGAIDLTVAKHCTSCTLVTSSELLQSIAT